MSERKIVDKLVELFTHDTAFIRSTEAADLTITYVLIEPEEIVDVGISLRGRKNDNIVFEDTEIGL